MKLKKMTIGYSLFFILIAGFFYLTYRNSPKHAYMLLAVVAASFLIGLIQPREKFVLIGVAVGIVGGFIVIIQSRKARENDIQQWFKKNGFMYSNIPDVASLFGNASVAGTTNYTVYQNTIMTATGAIPYLLAVMYHAQGTGKSLSIEFRCSYYFKENVKVDELEQACITAKNNTPHTNLIKSQLRYFDLEACDIFKPRMGGLVISWRVPHSVEGYSERYDWINNIFKTKNK